MRLWHYKLIPVLPNAMLVSQWRECIAIKRQWKKGTLKHRLVSYVMDYDKGLFAGYVHCIIDEFHKRNINYQDKYWNEIIDFCGGMWWDDYPEHNMRYLNQCLYNLQEKYDRGIVSEEEWRRIVEYQVWLFGEGGYTHG